MDTTPGRSDCRSSLRRKLLGEASSFSIFNCQSLLIEMCPTLEVTLDTIEPSPNRLDQVLTVSRKLKGYSKATGPLDTVRIVIDSKLHYNVYIFCDLIDGGIITNAQDVEKLPLLGKMIDSSWVVCHGIENYSSYKLFSVKDVVPVPVPPDTIRHALCQRIFQPNKLQKSRTCPQCLSMKYYLSSRKRNLDCLSSEDRLRRQSVHSTVSFDYLSPDSRSKRLHNMRSEIEVLRQKVRRNDQESSMELRDEQNEEMAEPVLYISESDIGLSQLDSIYQEADAAGEGKGMALKKIWDDDVEMFFTDQRKNGNYMITDLLVHFYFNDV